MKKYLYFVLTLFLTTCFISCSSDEVVEKESSSSEIIYTEDPEVLGDYDIGILDKTNSVLLLAAFDENSEHLERMDCISEDDLFLIEFNEEGKPKSIISNDSSVVVCFGNYSESTFDAAIYDGNEIFYIDSIDASEIEFTTKNLSSITRGFNYKQWEVLEGGFKSVLAVFKSASQAANGKKTDALKTFLKAFIEVISPVLSDDLKKIVNAIDEEILSDADGDEFATVVKIFTLVAKGGGPLAYLGILYDSYNLGESIGEWFAELKFQQEEIRNNLEAMLSSGNGALKVTLSWDFYADIDLHAFEPNGTHIYYGNPRSYRTGGYLDVDNTVGGRGAVENIYWENPEAGKYEFYLDYYGGSQSGRCTATVTYKGQGVPYIVPMTIDSWENFANRVVSGTTRADNEGHRLKMEVYLKPEKNKTTDTPIVVFKHE